MIFPVSVQIDNHVISINIIYMAYSLLADFFILMVW